ncbi:hypothetical protein [Haladaptatus salinisoli]|nr:hypothetical protein [Haladaptatus salinisoli]
MPQHSVVIADNSNECDALANLLGIDGTISASEWPSHLLILAK